MKADANQKLKLQYRKLLEMGMTISLLFCVILFQGSKRIATPGQAKQAALPTITQLDAVLTEQRRQKKQVTPPRIPVAAEEEEIIGEEIIPEWLDGEFGHEARLPSPPKEEDPYDFQKVEQLPRPVNGFKAIAEHLEYPEMAIRIGHEGRAIIRVKIDERGHVLRMLVQQSSGFKACDQSAMQAIRAVKWEPALQRDRPVSVWVSVPVDFKLR